MKFPQSKKSIIQRKQERGFSLLEVLIASTILSTAVAGSVALQSSLMQTTRKTNDRAFASEKVMQMFDEIRAHTEGNQESFDTSLATFSDGAEYNPHLTTNRLASSPADPLSANRSFNNAWRFTRQVQIEPLPNDQYSRRVTVSMWYADETGQPINQGHPLATITGILKTNIPRTPPTQVYDFYVIALGNVPSWWSNLYDFRPAYDAVFGDLEFRNPGLRLRKRYISNLAYGRDPFYLPHTNTENPLNHASTRLPWTYFYPGKVVASNVTGSPVKEDFAFKQITTRIRGDVDTKIFHVAEKGNVNQYRPAAMADEFNHGLRWPEQKAMEARLFQMSDTISNSSVLANPDLAVLKDSLQQPTLVSFLQGMNEGKYKNSMLSNMHAELTPIPPIVNYSYASKIPHDEHDANDRKGGAENKFARKRAVSHPERLFYPNSSPELNWRVYGYEMPHFGLSLDQYIAQDGTTRTFDPTAAMTETDRDELTHRHLEHISLFMPTDGAGPHPTTGAPTSGFLENPSFSPTGIITPSTLRITKIIGNTRAEYKYRKSLATWTDPDGDNYTTAQVTQARQRYLLATDQDVLLTTQLGGNTIRSSVTHNDQVQIVGRLSGVSSDRKWIAFRATNNLPTQDNVVTAGSALPVNTHHRNLIGDSIRINAVLPDSQAAAVNNTGALLTNSPNTETVIVLDARRMGNDESVVPSDLRSGAPAGTIFLRVAPNNNSTLGLRNNHTAGTLLNTGEFVTRHRDFELEYTNPLYSNFGNQRDGVLIHLYGTPTRHPQYTAGGNANSGGLPSNRRLYGLEYVPAPVNQGICRGTSEAHLKDDFMVDLADRTASGATSSACTGATNRLYNSRTGAIANSDAVHQRARNTARWIVGLDTSSTQLQNTPITLETRIMGGQSTNGIDLKSGSIAAYLEDGIGGDGDTYEPNNPTTGPNENETRLRKNLYNVSRSYLYRGTSFETAVPKVEQFQYIGDPRLVPYSDVKSRHGYNSAFYCPSGTGCGNINNVGFGYDDGAYRLTNAAPGGNTTDMGGYEGYDEQRGRYANVDGIDVAVERAFSLYTDGIMKSNSVYNTIAGFTNYIISLGGGIGQRGSHTYRYNTKISPWTTANNNATTTDNGEANSTTSERGSGGALRMVAANSPDTSTHANRRRRWTGFQYHGELFPDELYLFWKENGNLPNATFTNAADGLDTDGDTDLDSTPDVQTLPATINGINPRFYRAKYQDTPFYLRQRERITAEGAVSDFYNGSSDPANDNNRIRHSTLGGRGWLQGNPTAAGRYLSDAFNMSLPEQIDSTRSFCISNSSCSSPVNNNSSAYTTAWAGTRRNTIKYINITGPQQGQAADTASENNVFYRFHNGSDTNPNLNVASGLIKLTRPAVTTGSGTTPADASMVGYAVINGLEQGQLFGAQSLSRLAQAGTLQAFLEGGDRNIPATAGGRIVLLPRVEVKEPDTNRIQTPGSITVNFEVQWSRWDLRKYSPSYPDGWYESVPLQFNAMYSTNNGASWKYVNTNNLVPSEQLGHYNPNEQITPDSSYVMSNPLQDWSFSWDTTTFDEGDYLLRVDVFREGYDVGYSYHQQFLTFQD